MLRLQRRELLCAAVGHTHRDLAQTSCFAEGVGLAARTDLTTEGHGAPFHLSLQGTGR